MSGDKLRGTRTASPQDSARLMRAALKAAFPGVSFRVRMSRGTGWGSYYIDWTGGPTRAAVEEIVNPFEGKRFDGMDDSTHYRHQPISVDADGTTVLSGIGYISCQRYERAVPHA